MATIKLNKNKPASDKPSASGGPRRTPVRGAAGVGKPRPTLAQAQAERAERQAAYEQRRAEESQDDRRPGGGRPDARGGSRPDNRGEGRPEGRFGGRPDSRGPQGGDGRRDGRPDARGAGRGPGGQGGQGGPRGGFGQGGTRGGFNAGDQGGQRGGYGRGGQGDQRGGYGQGGQGGQGDQRGGYGQGPQGGQRSGYGQGDRGGFGQGDRGGQRQAWGQGGDRGGAPSRGPGFGGPREPWNGPRGGDHRESREAPVRRGIGGLHNEHEDRGSRYTQESRPHREDRYAREDRGDRDRGGYEGGQRSGDGRGEGRSFGGGEGRNFGGGDRGFQGGSDRQTGYGGPRGGGRSDGRSSEGRYGDRQGGFQGDRQGGFQGERQGGFQADRQAPRYGQDDRNARSGDHPGTRDAGAGADRFPGDRAPSGYYPDRPRTDRPNSRRDADGDNGTPRPRQPAPQRQVDPSEGERLSKRMSELGLASRREADEWIEAGWVTVDGKLAELGQRVGPDVKIEVDPAAKDQQAQRVTILLNKPIGYVSGQAEDGYEPASVLIKADTHWADDPAHIHWAPGHGRNLAPAGRLDIDSTGLLVLTQDGRIARHLIGEESNVEKEYLVRVAMEQGPDNVPAQHQLDPRALAMLNHGLELDGVELKPAKVSWANEDQLRFVLREGRKRQIRRMCELVGLKVLGLKRVRIGRIPLGQLPAGQWRYLAPWERF